MVNLRDNGIFRAEFYFYLTLFLFLLMKKHLLLLLFLFLGWSTAHAQIPDGTIAPNFNATDLNGDSYNLYSLLDSGYTVYLDFSATWCGPCWGYHNSGALEDLYNDYGPSGSNEVRVFFLEGDAATNLNCLYGPAGCVGGTQGNWVANTSYPIIHTQGPAIANSYQIGYFPTIFCICPLDKKVYEAGQLPASSLISFRDDKCAPPPLLVSTNSATNIKCFGTNTGAIDILPSGGVPPYTYAWSNGATTQDLNNIPAGTYTVTVSGGQGTQGVSDPIEVEGPAEPLVLVVENSTLVGCNGILASATVSASGGWNANYTYNWQNGQQGETAFSLNAGNHVVSVTDDNNCKVSITINIAPVVFPTAVIATPGTITCSQPTLQLNGSGSSSGPDIEYIWFAANGGNIVSGGTTATPTVDAAGNYTLRVTDIGTTCASFAAKPVVANIGLPMADAGPNQAVSCTDPETNLQGSGSSGSNFSYLWTPSNGGNIVSGGTTLAPLVDAVGSYTLKVTNSTNGCTNTSATLVTGTAAPILVTTSGELNCLVSSLKLTTTTNAANPGFVWTGPNNFSSSAQSPTVNISGSYVVIVTDSITLCTKTATANVTTNTSAPGASASGNTLTCVVNSVQIMGMTPDTNAIFAWTGPNGFQSPIQNPSVSDAGAYNLVVTDTLNGCTSSATAQVALNNAPPVASAVSPGNLNCNTSQLQLNGTGSSQGVNISYTWTATNGGNIVSGEATQTPLVNAAGTYSILVTNATSGCTQTASANVVQNTLVSAAISSQSNVLCNGASNGAATTAAAGGNGVYQYLWTNGATTAQISGLAAGTYVVVVTDGENCSASITANIAQPAALQANASTTGQTAFGENDGSATTNPSGGTAGYTYFWSNGGTTQAITDLAPGNYNVVVTDANGCTRMQTVTVNAFNCFLAVSIVGTDIACNGENNGTASVTIQGGADPITYLWNNGETAQNLANLAAGDYTVNITDGNNCPSQLSISINQPAALLVNANTTAETALGANDGSATANPTGGNEPYQYLWSNGANTVAIQNLMPGTYTVEITDANGCTMPQTVEVSSFLCAISSQNNVVNISCAGASDGSISISLVGGEAPFTYSWSNGANSSAINNLAGGTYTVEINDVNGCGFSSTATVTEPSALSPIEIESVNPLCPNDASGSATATISGGTEPYTYLWSNGSTSNMLTNATSGNYNIQISDANGCQSSASVSLVANDNEIPTVTAQNATITLNNSGLAQVTLVKINAQFNDNCGIASAVLSPQNFDCSQLGTQTVTLTVTDLSGNTASTTAAVMVVDNIVPVLSCPADIVRCSYDNTVDYASPVAEDNCLLVGNGQWLVDGPASGATFPEGTTEVVYTYTDASGNSGNCAFEVTITSAVLFTNVVVNNDLNAQQVGSINITVDGGTGPFQYQWTDESGQLIGQTEDIAGLGAGIYQVQVTDANGCVYAREEIKLDNTVGLKEPLWLTGVTLQPNPTTGLTQVIFGTPVSTTLEITVLDAMGRIVRTDISERESTVRLDCSDLPGGVYILRFRTGREVGVRRLVVQR